MREHHGAPRA